MIDSDEAVKPGSGRFNEAWKPRHDGDDACAKTRPLLPIGLGEQMLRSRSLRGRAGQRSVTGREERVTRPVRREMKPEATDAADDAAGDFEQMETDGADRRRRQARAGEDRAAEVREQQQRERV